MIYSLRHFTLQTFLFLFMFFILIFVSEKDSVPFYEEIQFLSPENNLHLRTIDWI